VVAKIKSKNKPNIFYIHSKKCRYMAKIYYCMVLAALLALAAGEGYALELNVTLTNEVGTRLPGSAVDILVGNTVLYTKNTSIIDDRAVAQFTIAPGTYFIRLRRGGYPDHIYLQTLENDTEMKFIMLMRRSTYTIYGQVEGETSLAGRSIKLIDETGAVAKSSTIKGSGYYLIDSLWPTKKYYLWVDGPIQPIFSENFSYDAPGAYYIPIKSKPIEKEIEEFPQLAAPASAKIGERIAVSLMVGSRPMAGQEIKVITPDGEFSITTDSQGLAYIQAAESGDYVFEWGGLKQKVNVPSQEQAPKIEETKKEESMQGNESQENAQVPKGNNAGYPSASSEAEGNTAIFGIAAFAAAAALILAAIILIGLKIRKERSGGQAKIIEEEKANDIVQEPQIQQAHTDFESQMQDESKMQKKKKGQHRQKHHKHAKKKSR
jgi:hypothetical protein